MPIYEYRCERCEREFEELVRLSTRDDEVPCPECGAHEARRRLSVVAGFRGGASRNTAGGSGCRPGSGFT